MKLYYWGPGGQRLSGGEDIGRHGLPHIATGDVFRANIIRAPNLGNMRISLTKASLCPTMSW